MPIKQSLLASDVERERLLGGVEPMLDTTLKLLKRRLGLTNQFDGIDFPLYVHKINVETIISQLWMPPTKPGRILTINQEVPLPYVFEPGNVCLDPTSEGTQATIVFDDRETPRMQINGKGTYKSHLQSLLGTVITASLIPKELLLDVVSGKTIIIANYEGKKGPFSYLKSNIYKLTYHEKSGIIIVETIEDIDKKSSVESSDLTYFVRN